MSDPRNEKQIQFDNFRFSGLNYSMINAKTFTMDRVSADENKIVVRVSKNSVRFIKSKKRYKMMLNQTHCLYFKPWQVSILGDYAEILMNRNYFHPAKVVSGNCGGSGILQWSYWVDLAKTQSCVSYYNGELKDYRVLWRR